MDNHIKYFKDIILYDGEFYFHKPDTVYLHNRMNFTYTFKNINIIPINGLDSNMGHLIWDCMYPS